MNSCIKYPSIDQYRNLIKSVEKYYEGVSPKLLMSGTVKVHGTNSSVVIRPDGSQYAQSRNNVITIENDNCGFAKWHETRKDVGSAISKQVRNWFFERELV